MDGMPAIVQINLEYWEKCIEKFESEATVSLCLETFVCTTYVNFDSAWLYYSTAFSWP